MPPKTRHAELDSQYQFSTKHFKLDHIGFLMTNDKNEETNAKPEAPVKEFVVVSKLSDIKLKPITNKVFLQISFLLFVLLPSCLGILYNSFVASDRYVSDAGFVIRVASENTLASPLGAITGIGNGDTVSDTYIVQKYLTSRAIIERLQHDIDIKAHYSSNKNDFISRLAPEARIEQFSKYWQKRISVSHDAVSGIITYRVQGFEPKYTKLIADKILEYSRQLVNDISVKAREDAVKISNQDVAVAAKTYRDKLKALKKFRQNTGLVDPSSAATNQVESVMDLNKKLIDIRTRIDAIKPSLVEESPALQNLRRQETSLKLQIEAQINGHNSPREISKLLAEYEELEIEKSFAQQAYSSSLASLEKSRQDADRQQRYFAVYTAPNLPEHPLFPKRIMDSLLIIVMALSIWGIFVLLAYSVRDHLS